MERKLLSGGGLEKGLLHYVALYGSACVLIHNEREQLSLYSRIIEYAFS